MKGIVTICALLMFLGSPALMLAQDENALAPAVDEQPIAQPVDEAKPAQELAASETKSEELAQPKEEPAATLEQKEPAPIAEPDVAAEPQAALEEKQPEVVFDESTPEGKFKAMVSKYQVSGIMSVGPEMKVILKSKDGESTQVKIGDELIPDSGIFVKSITKNGVLFSQKSIPEGMDPELFTHELKLVE